MSARNCDVRSGQRYACHVGVKIGADALTVHADDTCYAARDVKRAHPWN